MSKEYMNDGSLSEKWKYRFNFYDQHGFPGFWGATPEYKAAFKALKVRQRLTIQMNFIAFFCSWIYLFVLGLWKKAIIVLLLGILSLFVGALIGVNILGIAVAAYVAVNTNKWFYEKGVEEVRLRATVSRPVSHQRMGTPMVENDSGYKLGQRVRHAKFGEGTIVNMEGSGEHSRLQVAFQGQGIKWLVAAYARLESV